MTTVANKRRWWSWVIAIGVIGALLIWLPPKVIEYVERLRQSSPAVAVVLGMCALVGVVLIAASAVMVYQQLAAASWAKSRRRKRDATSPNELTPEEQEAELQEHIRQVDQLLHDPRLPEAVRRELQRMLEELERKRSAERLEIVAFGAISSGKSALLNLLAGKHVFNVDIRGGTTVSRNEIVWPNDQKVILVDTPGLGEIHGEQRGKMACEAAQHADVILMVLDGPLRDFEYELLQLLARMGKHVLLCLNKVDWYQPRDLELLREQIAEQVAGLVSAQDIVLVAAQPVKRRVVRVLPDGTEIEEEREEMPNIDQLAERLMNLLGNQRRALLMGNLLLQARGMADQARERVADALTTVAKETVDRYAFAAAVASAVSPVPLIDLVAAGGITAKMIIDVADIFGKQLDLDAAWHMIKQLSGVLATTIGTSVVAPVAAAVLGSLLKVVPGVGTLVGSALQGAVQLLVVRWVGRSAVSYYRHELLNRPRSLAEIAADEWKQITSIAELQKIAQEAQQQFGKPHT